MREKLNSLLSDFSANLSQHERNQYMPKLRDFLIYYILKEYSHETDLETLFGHEFTRSDVIKSTEFYILENKNVKSKSAIDDFLIALNRLFEELLNDKYPNQNLRNIQPFIRFNKEVERNLEVLGRHLKEREENPPINEKQFIHICNFINSSERETSSALQVRIILKLLLLYGFKFNRIADFSIYDLDIEMRILKVKCPHCSGGFIKLELPYSLFQDFKKYYKLRMNMNTEHQKLFLTRTFSPITNSFITESLKNMKNSYYSESEIRTLVKNPFTATGLSKFAIINMILQGMNQATIFDVTGINNDIYQNCQEHVNELLSEDYNRHINYKIRAISAYDLL